MKHILPLIFSVLSALIAQAIVVEPLTPPAVCETMANDSFAGEVIDMPGTRPIWSGSKIIVSYDQDVPQEMIGAFDFATKLWEEVLPTTLPITMRVELSQTMRGKSKISTVLPMKLNGYSTNYTDCSLPFSATNNYGHSLITYEFEPYADSWYELNSNTRSKSPASVNFLTSGRYIGTTAPRHYVFDLNGRMIWQGGDLNELKTVGYKGIVIVKSISGREIKTNKLILN